MEFLRFEMITELDTVYLSDELIPTSNAEAALTVTNPSVGLPNFSPLSSQDTSVFQQPISTAPGCR
jgi:hypothetical protein